MKPGKIAQDIDNELKREQKRKARAVRLKKIEDEYKKKEGGKYGKRKKRISKNI